MSTTSEDQQSSSLARPGKRLPAVLLGIAAVIVTIGIAEILAAAGARFGPLSGSASPFAALGAAFIEIAPATLVEWAKQTLGAPGDKIALGVGMVLTLAALGAVVGLLSRRRFAWAAGLAVAAGALAGWAIVTRGDASVLDLLPLVIGVSAGLFFLRRSHAADEHIAHLPRRDLLRYSGIGALAGLMAAGLSRWLGPGVTAAASRAATTLPPVAPESVSQQPAAPPSTTGTSALTPRTTTQPALSGTLDEVPGISPYVTANADFYRIDTAFTIPQIPTGAWTLRVHGMVDAPFELNFAELLALPMIERYITLTCVSNPRGGDLVGNARWQGTLTRELLARARPQAGADCVLSTDKQGWTCSTPLEALTDDRDSMLAIGMNGEPLPLEHGFPVRMVVPGLYGYVSATKWVVDWKVTRFDQDMAYWTGLGWAEQAPIKTQSRIDIPRERAGAGRVPIGGVAWAQHRGIKGVEVQIRPKGGEWGPWLPAETSRPVSIDTWVQWVHYWDAKPGTYSLRCRAINPSGMPQRAEDSDVLPDGATGYHQTDVTIS